jgi:hypothetical protein
VALRRLTVGPFSDVDAALSASCTSTTCECDEGIRAEGALKGKGEHVAVRTWTKADSVLEQDRQEGQGEEETERERERERERAITN